MFDVCREPRPFCCGKLHKWAVGIHEESRVQNLAGFEEHLLVLVVRLYLFVLCVFLNNSPWHILRAFGIQIELQMASCQSLRVPASLKFLWAPSHSVRVYRIEKLLCCAAHRLAQQQTSPLTQQQIRDAQPEQPLNSEQWATHRSWHSQERI